MPPGKKPKKHFRRTPRVAQNWKRFIEKAHERLYSDFFAGFHTIRPEEQLEKLAKKGVVNHIRGRFRFTDYAHLNYFLLNGSRSKWEDMSPAKRERLAHMVVSSVHAGRVVSAEDTIRVLGLYRSVLEDKQIDIQKQRKGASIKATSFQEGIEHFARYHFAIDALDTIISDVRHGRRDWRTGARAL